MDNIPNLEELIRKTGFVESLYDAIRLVDPVHNTVGSYLKKNPAFNLSCADDCFRFWGRNEVCHNCISMRSFNQKRPIVKIEYRNDKIYLVTAAPLDQERMVIELLKDITEDGILNVEGLGPAEIRRLISRRNESIIKDAVAAIYNEQYIFERLPQDMAAAGKIGASLAVFLIRIVKPVMSSQSRSARESFVKQVAGALSRIPYKRSDWVSRYHEADFVLVMQDMTENKANRVCLRIQENIHKLRFPALPPNAEIEIRAGYHIISGEKLSPEQAIEQAAGMPTQAGAVSTNNNSVDQYAVFFNEYTLTEREKEVARLLAGGDSNSEIAGKIFVGLSTVKKHVSAILLKTGAKSRTGLIAKMAGQPPK